MKNFKKLLVLGAALMATVTLPMNWGGRFASRIGKLGAEFAGKAKTAGLNIKANPFPVFCKAVSSGVLPYAVIRTGLAMQQRGFKGERKPVDAKVAEFVRGSFNIPVLFELNEKDEAYIDGFVQALRNKGSLGLTADQAIRHFHLNAAAGPAGIIFNAAMYKLLSCPHLFGRPEEYEKFREHAKAIVQHEGGHYVENHSLQQWAWVWGSPILLYKAGKHLGPLTRRLVGMNPNAKTKLGMFGRAIGGGVLKGVGTLTGALALQKHHEYRADNYVDDEHKKYQAYGLYLVSRSCWHSFYPDRCCRNNLHPHNLLLSTHPHSANRIRELCGSFEKFADFCVQEARLNELMLRKQEIEELDSLKSKTEEEKIAFFVTRFGWPKDVTTWNETPDNLVIKGAQWTIEQIKFFENESDPHWAKLKGLVIKDMEDALSLSHNIKGAVREKGNEYMKQYARSIMEQEIKDVERLQKMLLELPEEEQIKFFEAKFNILWETVQLEKDERAVNTFAEKVAALADSYSTKWYVDELLKYREEQFKNNNPEAESQSLSQSFQAKMFPKYYEALDELWTEREAAQAKAAAEAQQKVEQAAAEALKNAKQEAEQAAEPANADEQKQ